MLTQRSVGAIPSKGWGMEGETCKEGYVGGEQARLEKLVFGDICGQHM